MFICIIFKKESIRFVNNNEFIISNYKNKKKVEMKC